MSTIEVSLSIKVDGQEIPGGQMVRRLEVDEQTGQLVYEQATGGGYAAIPGTSALTEVQFLFVKPNKQMTLRLDAQSDAGIIINANGMVLLLDVDIDAGASTNATLDNASGSTAIVKALAAGT